MRHFLGALSLFSGEFEIQIAVWFQAEGLLGGEGQSTASVTSGDGSIRC